MDDLATFEQRVASEVIRGMGPSEPVDDAAILAAEIVGVEIPGRKGEVTIVDRDEHPRLTPLDKLGQLRPAGMRATPPAPWAIPSIA